MDKSWTIRDLIRWSSDYLGKKGVSTPRLDTELLLCLVLGMDRVCLYMNLDLPLNRGELGSFRKMLKRRAAREPLQYITGFQEFWSMHFRVTPNVLIPRPETELLVEEGARELRKSFPQSRDIKILDLGTGSGALAAALAREIKGSAVTATDISAEAVKLARENAEANYLSSSLTIIEGDLFEPVREEAYHLIVSNPPYIPGNALVTLQPEVRAHEPLSALDGGPDGLDFYRAIIPTAPRHLEDGGWLVLENGMGQSPDIMEMFDKTGAFEEISSVKDYAGIDRVVKGKRKKK